MATGTLPEPDQDEKNIGQTHSNDLFNNPGHPKTDSQDADNSETNGGGSNPSADSASGNGALAAAENNVKPPKTPGKNIAQDEGGAKMPSSEELYKRSAENRKAGGKRGVFIGVGAGGGLISVIAGFAFMLPFKLPGI